MKKLLAMAFIGAAAFAAVPAAAETVDVGGAAYIVVDEATPEIQVWQESNGEAGLQTEDSDTAPADTRVL